MNYFPFHLGDYSAHTGHLDLLEDLAYRRCLDAYYLREGPLPKDASEVARIIRMRDHAATVRDVLNEFFELCEDGWRHARCDQEIDRMRDKQSKARASAQASVNARKANAQRTFNERSTGVELPTPTPTPTPTEVLQGSLIPAIPDCPHSEILRLWAEKLPAAIQPADWNEKRQQLLRSRWREKKNRQDIEWWQRLFEYIEKSDFLMGRVNANGRKAFSLSLDWLCKSDNFLKVIEGKYHEAEVQA